MRRLAIAITFVALSCAGQKPARKAQSVPDSAEAPAQDATKKGAAKKGSGKGSPLFPKREHGWKALSTESRAKAASFAEHYADFLARSKTPRRAAKSLLALAESGGAAQLTPGERPHGDLYAFAARGQDAAAFVRLGERPLSEGLRIIVASIDAPRIDLKQEPVYERAGVALFDTFLYGDIELAHWLSHPMALYIYVARPSGALDLAIGEAQGDPILTIPDLLPHLSRKVQRRETVDSAERMDAIASGSGASLQRELSRRGLEEGELAGAEAYLVPAGEPTFVGVDRALLSGHGHRDRALAYAALRALLSGARPEKTAVVIAVSKAQIGGTGPSGLAFVESALARILGAGGPTQGGDKEPDLYDSGRALARSELLISAPTGGARDRGVALSLRGDDSLPAAARRALERMRSGGAQVQIVSERGRHSAARRLGTLDLDAVAVGLPIQGAGAPRELLSTLDLYQGYLAFEGWLGP